MPPESSSPYDLGAHLPKVRGDLTIRRMDGSGEIHYVVKDPVSHSYYRFPEAGGMILAALDGSTDLTGLQKQFEDNGHVPPDLDALEAFVTQLRQMGLLESSPGQRWEDGPAEGENPPPPRGPRGSILSARIPLWDPDRWMSWAEPRLRFFWTRTFLWGSLALILIGLIRTAALWDRFSEEAYLLFSGRASLADYLLFGLVSFCVGVLHELGHGLTCKHYGGQVHEIGFLLLYFMPCFYCNVSDAWLLERRNERLWVTLAGGYIQLCIGTVAVLAWGLALPSTLPAKLLFLTVLAGHVGSVAVNLNPLLKLDGYYALSDYLDLPNLRERSFDYLRRVGLRRVLGRPVEIPALPDRRRRIYLAYGVLAGVYSVAFLGGVAFQVYGFVRAHGPH